MKQTSRASRTAQPHRTLHELESRLLPDRLVFVAMIALYIYLSGKCSVASSAAVVMLIMGFFFATVSGNLVGHHRLFQQSRSPG